MMLLLTSYQDIHNRMLIAHGFVVVSNNICIDLMNLKTAKGLALRDMLTEVHLYVHRSRTSFLLIIQMCYFSNRSF